MFHLARRRLGNSALLHRPSSVFSTSSPYSTDASNVKKPGPPPIEVSLTESAGRGVFATQPIVAGDLIHTAKPLVSHPSLSSIHSVCYFCLRRLKNVDTAPLAKTVSFCSDECREQSKAFYEVEQTADWSLHDEYCRINGLKYPLLAKRVACMVISGAVSADCLDILQPSYLAADMISKMEEGFNLLRNAFTTADMTDEQMAWYTSLLARIRINAFRIELTGGSYEDLLSLAAASVEAEAAVGNAVYMLPSFYNHDCDPNVHIIWLENVVARLKALRDIEPGEELQICYIDTSLDRNARQAILSQGFGFHCSCLRCTSGD